MGNRMMTEMIENNKVRLSAVVKFCVVLSLISFLVSLTQPAFFIDRPEDPNAWSNSLFLLLLGWMSALGGAGDAFYIWLANPLYITAIILVLRKRKSGIYYSFISTILAFIFLLLPRITTSESGSTSAITGRGLGFWLWFSAFIILSAGLTVEFIKNKKKSNSKAAHNMG